MDGKEVEVLGRRKEGDEKGKKSKEKRENITRMCRGESKEKKISKSCRKGEDIRKYEENILDKGGKEEEEKEEKGKKE